MLKNLRSLREEKGLSQQKLADLFGISQQSINKYENHNIEPDIETLIKMAEYFETSIDYLVGNTETRRKIEPVKTYDLNSDENCLVDKYRQLPLKFRKSIMSLMDDFLSKQLND